MSINTNGLTLNALGPVTIDGNVFTDSYIGSSGIAVRDTANIYGPITDHRRGIRFNRKCVVGLELL